MDSKYKFEDILLIISLSIAFSTRVGNYVIPNEVLWGVILIWILFAMMKFVVNINGWKTIKDKNIIIYFLKYNFNIKLAIYIYTLVLILLNLTERRFLSSNLYTFINGLSSVAIFYLYKERALKCSVIALFIAYGGGCLASILSGSLFFEFHDIGFASGFIAIYYMKVNGIKKKRDFLSIIMIYVIMLLTFKRIGIAALAIVMCMYFFIKNKPEKKKNKWLDIFKWLFLVSIYVFLIIVSNGELWELIKKIGIEMSGRNYYYLIFRYIAKLSPGFLGLGRNALYVLCHSDYSYMRVSNIHSDILRMYAECGFWIFITWLWNYFIAMPKKAYEIWGYDAKEIILLCTFYVFITYFTDNTELYLITQYFYCLVPITYIYKIKRKDCIV